MYTEQYKSFEVVTLSNSFEAKTSSQTLIPYLDEIIDVGRITCCKAAEDY